MVDTRRKTVHSKPPVSPDMYRSLYKRDYPWCKQYKPPNKEDMQKLQIADSQLKAKEFAVPCEERAMIYSDSVVRERRQVIPAPSRKASSRASDAGGRQAEGSASSLKALQQRKHFTSALPSAESYLPKYYSATKPAATQAEKLERLQALAERENELSYCQRLPAAAQTTGTAGMFLRRQKLAPGWVTYQQFTQEMYQTRQHDAQQNRNMVLGSSVFVEECFDFDWRSTYKTDFQRWPGACGGYCRANKSLSHIFPEDEHLNQNRWVSEYKDSYSISLQRLNWSSQIPAVGLHSGLSPRKRTAMDTAH
ncbi:uncharacterized protein LOC115338888 [Aquila chrysaetos chrysaetos]|uniref:uncharacterized protein LOC115338888 n=1 Tax=Aquila chrysaetos chrysaetos TaxID=223781 RepID=UPI00117718D2|nr:uncharacterized protein LOC115338888 [Aquila chrysaetos chrysaetos]